MASQRDHVSHPGSHKAKIVANKSGPAEIIQEDLRNCQKQNQAGNLPSHQQMGNSFSHEESLCVLKIPFSCGIAARVRGNDAANPRRDYVARSLNAMSIMNQPVQKVDEVRLRLVANLVKEGGTEHEGGSIR